MQCRPVPRPPAVIALRVHPITDSRFQRFDSDEFDAQSPRQPLVDEALPTFDGVAAIDDDGHRHPVELLIQGSNLVPLGDDQRRGGLGVLDVGKPFVSEPVLEPFDVVPECFGCQISIDAGDGAGEDAW